MHTVEKNPTTAFLLSLFPGIGHLYLGKYGRTLLYGGGAAAPIVLFLLFTAYSRELEPGAFFAAAFVVFVVWCVNLIDMAVTLAATRASGEAHAASPSQMRTAAAALSLLPGVGHIYLGRTQRGMLLFLGALGSLAVSLAAAVVLREEMFLLGFLAAPALAAYAAIDAVDEARRIVSGERSLAGDSFDAWFEPGPDGRRPAFACFLSIVPGAGHLYVGAFATGIRLLVSLLLLLYLASEHRIELAKYLLPLLWLYSFFDVLRLAAPYGMRDAGRAAPEERGSFLWTAHGFRWAGAALIAAGVYVALDRVALPFVMARFPEWTWIAGYRAWSEPLIAALAFICAGIDLLRRTRSSTV